MKKQFKLLIFLIMIFYLSSIGFAYAEDAHTIQPRYVKLKVFICELSVDSGYAFAIGEARCDTGYKVLLQVDLQKYNNSKWSTIKTWYGNKNLQSDLEAKYKLDSGYNYRLECTAIVYDANDKVIESPKIYSKELYY